jgi:hypothetical protein
MRPPKLLIVNHDPIQEAGGINIRWETRVNPDAICRFLFFGFSKATFVEGWVTNHY